MPKPGWLTIEAMRRFAARKGGRCLSDVYIDQKTPLVWECSALHRWASPYLNIRLGYWCGQCGYARAASKNRGTIERARELAREHGGKCLSDAYAKTSARLRWECGDGHTFEKSVDAVRQGQWCPHCKRSMSRGERIARLILEAMFSAPFPKKRPAWLKVGDGVRRRLELDGYAEEKRIAFEYHGRQHYEATGGLFCEGVVAAQRERDATKAMLCREHGVTLVVVPEFTNDRSLAACIQQVEFSVTWAGLSLPRRWKRPISLGSVDLPLDRVFGAGGVAELRRIATEKGGALLSKRAPDSKERLEWECKEGHRWPATAGNIRNGGSWCPYCSGRAPLTMERMRELAAKHGGRCLSDTYVNSQAKLWWECEVGHSFEKRPNDVQQGHWCVPCAWKRGAAKRSAAMASTSPAQA